MEAKVPVEVGTRGTVRSLVMKEIEYFSKLELDCHGSFRKPQEHVVNLASRSGNSWPSFGFRVMTCRRKKRRGSGFLPSICSQVEVADSHQLNGIPGFSYRNLKADVKKFEQKEESVLRRVATYSLVGLCYGFLTTFSVGPSYLILLGARAKTDISALVSSLANR
ncbi:hypothetical protein F0562_018901 [Nyssa sinensis]|uniref:Uncharacterized protein n=1 Tax=Nyssa sinensis TaxID=561372 RepID=A0A5J4ZD40_9ASTE|nr:hypothetical protein F0562_018901 [Nyssa sinensis]